MGSLDRRHKLLALLAGWLLLSAVIFVVLATSSSLRTAAIALTMMGIIAGIAAALLTRQSVR